MQIARAAIFFIAFALWLPSWGQALQPVPALTGHVVDHTGTLGDTQKQALEDKLAALEQAKGSQVVVLMVPTTQPEDIASYANRIGNAWKIGRQGVGDGLLLLVAKLGAEAGFGGAAEQDGGDEVPAEGFLGAGDKIAQRGLGLRGESGR